MITTFTFNFALWALVHRLCKEFKLLGLCDVVEIEGQLSD